MTSRTIGQPIAAGLVTAFVGFASSFAVVLKGLSAVGATDSQAASGLMALSIAMGIAGIVLSVGLRMPVSVAWSTPGAALLAATGATPGGFPAAVGAFLVVGALLVVAGLFRPFARLVAAIPGSLANAMLAGVLFGLCLKPIGALIAAPVGASLIVLAWLVVSRWKRIYATPVAALVAALVIAGSGRVAGLDLMVVSPRPELVWPTFSLGALVGIAAPLFIVTMASQNIPGLAVMGAYGYRPDPGRLVWTTGAFSLASAPFGGHAVNLSSIVAALCASPDASPDPAKRWIAAVTAGATYIVFGLLAGLVTAFAAGAPILVEAVAGLALLGPFGSALHNALADSQEREAALVTFLVTSSGVTIFNVGGAFWGLVAGGAVLVLTRAGASLSPRQAP
ncbi:benzoate membrane transport protein [Roseiarcus fermentans]|uniref:Benzoate membrane transport protein n=1 Tax=Roseiarcus fermentans TaxID=1473586 RepID=A0A366FQ36_9HYPH|nr:benzoate/H(+) symporter BenE family transporter [Roseiarcus fermentans]RBP15835.1 benzoate membrane transport protein [Roseiarcus fermentans]